MLHAKGAYGPSYNVQISTDAQAKIIVGVGVTQAPTDAAELGPAVDRVEANLDQRPEQMVVDAGFTNQATMEAMTEKQVDLIGALPKRKGVASESVATAWSESGFFPSGLEYDASADCYRCPAGKVLFYETQERQGASLRRRYSEASGTKGRVK